MDNKTCGVYSITNLVNGHRYIGSSVSVEKRWNNHLYELKRGHHHSQHLQRAVNKYGIERFEFEILMTSNEAQVIGCEQQFIDQLRPEYNISPTAGSCRGRIATAEHGARISAAKKGKKRPPVTEETRKKLSAAGRRRGKRNPHTAEAKAKMRVAKKGKKRSVEAKAAVSSGITEWWRKRKLQAKRDELIRQLGY